MVTRFVSFGFKYGVPAEADGGIDEQTRRGRRQQLDHPIGKHGDVDGAHRCPPSQLQLREFFEFLITQRRFLEE